MRVVRGLLLADSAAGASLLARAAQSPGNRWTGGGVHENFRHLGSDFTPEAPEDAIAPGLSAEPFRVNDPFPTDGVAVDSLPSSRHPVSRRARVVQAPEERLGRRGGGCASEAATAPVAPADALRPWFARHVSQSAHIRADCENSLEDQCTTPCVAGDSVTVVDGALTFEGTVRDAPATAPGRPASWRVRVEAPSADGATRDCSALAGCHWRSPCATAPAAAAAASNGDSEPRCFAMTYRVLASRGMPNTKERCPPNTEACAIFESSVGSPHVMKDGKSCAAPATAP